MYPLCVGFYILQNLWTFSLVTLKTYLHPVVFHPLSKECISVLSAALSFQNISFWKYGGWSQIRKKTDKSDKNVIHSFHSQLSEQLGHVHKSKQTHETVYTILHYSDPNIFTKAHCVIKAEPWKWKKKNMKRWETNSQIVYWPRYVKGWNFSLIEWGNSNPWSSCLHTAVPESPSILLSHSFNPSIYPSIHLSILTHQGRWSIERHTQTKHGPNCWPVCPGPHISPKSSWMHSCDKLHPSNSVSAWRNAQVDFSRTQHWT